MTLPTRGIEATAGLEFDKFIEATSTPGQFGVVVLSSTGADISGGGGSTTPYSSTASAPSSVSVGVASALAVAANASRKGLVLTSLLGNTGRISLSLVAASPAVVDSGMILLPGDSFTMDAFTFTVSQINAISNVAAQTLSIQELV